MSRQSPFLQRRGDAFCFRIAVPHDLRLCVGSRELGKRLHTGDKLVAVPRAVALAMHAKRLFFELRSMATDTGKNDPQFVVDLAVGAGQKLTRFTTFLRKSGDQSMRAHLRRRSRSCCHDSCSIGDRHAWSIHIWNLQQKQKPRQGGVFVTIECDQAAVFASLRRRATKPIRPKPASIMA